MFNVHAKFKQYREITERCYASGHEQMMVQVGDFGLGFQREGDLSNQEILDYVQYRNHWIVRGNHDSVPMFRNLDSYIGNQFRFINKFSIVNGMLFVAGAESIDKRIRVSGVDYWPDEELSMPEFYDIIGQAQRSRPTIVFSHAAPSFVAHEMLGSKAEKHSRTEIALAALAERVNPDFWFFGHYHRSWTRKIGSTRFQCLDELEVYTL
jgi:predicted phosphodiesterase